ncbi:MAG: OsmC family protein, partial [Methanoregula sp.]|nr:OsmC family protein [Methanoregula sp.]
APNAVELVLSALGACLTVGVAYVAAQQGIMIHSLKFTIEGELDIRGFFGMKGIHPGYEQISVTVHLHADAERKKLETLLSTVIETSPVRDIIARNVPVNIQLAKPE